MSCRALSVVLAAWSGVQSLPSFVARPFFFAWASSHSCWLRSCRSLLVRYNSRKLCLWLIDALSLLGRRPRGPDLPRRQQPLVIRHDSGPGFRHSSRHLACVIASWCVALSALTFISFCRLVAFASQSGFAQERALSDQYWTQVLPRSACEACCVCRSIGFIHDATLALFHHVIVIIHLVV